MRHYQRGIGTVIVLVLFLIIGVAIASAVFIFDQNQKASVNSFEDCAKLYPVMESYPAQCNTPDGRHFVQVLSEEERQKLVPPTQPSPSMKACTLEAKICPDGSSVGRTGPNCEFAACPGEIDTSNWKTFTHEKFGYSISYPEEEFGFIQGMVSQPDGVKLKATDAIELVAKNDSRLSRLIVWVGNSKDSPGFGQPNIFDEEVKTKKVIIDGISALESVEDLGGPYGSKQIGVIKGGYFYIIEAAPDFDSKYREIIKTFKFTN